MKKLLCLTILPILSSTLFAQVKLKPEYLSCRISHFNLLSPAAGEKSVGELLDPDALICSEKGGGTVRVEMELSPGNPETLKDGYVVEFYRYNGDSLEMGGGIALDFDTERQIAVLKAVWFEPVGGEFLFAENFGDAASMGETFGMFAAMSTYFFD